jgi:hypothetical protein
MDESTLRLTLRLLVDMFAWQEVRWPVMLDDVHCLDTLDIGTVWLGDEYAGYASKVQTASGRWMRSSRLSNTRK